MTSLLLPLAGGLGLWALGVRWAPGSDVGLFLIYFALEHK